MKSLDERHGRNVMNIPRNDSTAWVIKCDYNHRYFWSIGGSLNSPLTVGLMHAERFPTRFDAEWALRQVQAAAPNVPWRIVRLVRRTETAKDEGAKR